MQSIIRFILAKIQSIPLSTYGYGMMALSTAILVLMFNGFFNAVGFEYFLAWFIAAMALASGALSVLLINQAFPQEKKSTAVLYITLLTVILMGGYLTSFFGYSKVYILFSALNHPEIPLEGAVPFGGLSMVGFMEFLKQIWVAVFLSAILCSLCYLVIQLSAPNPKKPAEEDNPASPEGLAE